MQVTLIKLLVTLLTVSVGGYSSVSIGSKSAAQPTEQSHVAATNEADQAADSKEIPAPVAEGSTVQQTDTEQGMPVPVERAETETQTTLEETKSPITGAFAIPLGESFAPWMVTKIISQEEKKYKTRGEGKTEYTGTLYQVEPNIPNQYFNDYSLKTNKDGIIYAISAEQLPVEKASACETTKKIAAYLAGKYGKPRGKGMLGDWYTFRESATGPYKGIRLYAQRCRNGRFSIVYTDDTAMLLEVEPKAEPGEMSGL